MLLFIVLSAYGQSISAQWECPTDFARSAWRDAIGPTGPSKIARGIVIERVNISSRGECGSEIEIFFQKVRPSSADYVKDAVINYLRPLKQQCFKAEAACLERVQARVEKAKAKEVALAKAKKAKEVALAKAKKAEAEAKRQESILADPLAGVWGARDEAGNLVYEVVFQKGTTCICLAIFNHREWHCVKFKQGDSPNQIILDNVNGNLLVVDVKNDGSLLIEGDKFTRLDRVYSIHELYAPIEVKQRNCLNVCESEKESCEYEWHNHPSCKTNWYACTSRCKQ